MYTFVKWHPLFGMLGMSLFFYINEKNGMKAATPDPTLPSESSLKPPSSTDEKEDVVDSNPAKKYHGFNAWNTWNYC